MLSNNWSNLFTFTHAGPSHATYLVRASLVSDIKTNLQSTRFFFTIQTQLFQTRGRPLTFPPSGSPVQHRYDKNSKLATLREGRPVVNATPPPPRHGLKSPKEVTYSPLNLAYHFSPGEIRSSVASPTCQCNSLRHPQ